MVGKAVAEDVIVEGHKPLTDGNHSQEPTRPVQRSPEVAFSVEQLTDWLWRQISDLIPLVVGGVDVSDVLIDFGAICNANRPGATPFYLLFGLLFGLLFVLRTKINCSGHKRRTSRSWLVE